MELIEAAPGKSITIKFTAEEFAKMLIVMSVAAQEHESLDREMLHHITGDEIGVLAGGLRNIFD